MAGPDLDDILKRLVDHIALYEYQRMKTYIQMYQNYKSPEPQDSLIKKLYAKIHRLELQITEVRQDNENLRIQLAHASRFRRDFTDNPRNLAEAHVLRDAKNKAQEENVRLQTAMASAQVLLEDFTQVRFRKSRVQKRTFVKLLDNLKKTLQHAPETQSLQKQLLQKDEEIQKLKDMTSAQPLLLAKHVGMQAEINQLKAHIASMTQP